MKTLVVLTFDAPSPETVVEILKAIDPPNLPHFAGTARVVVEPTASHVERYLDSDDEDLDP